MIRIVVIVSAFGFLIYFKFPEISNKLSINLFQQNSVNQANNSINYYENASGKVTTPNSPITDPTLQSGIPQNLSKPKASTEGETAKSNAKHLQIDKFMKNNKKDEDKNVANSQSAYIITQNQSGGSNTVNISPSIFIPLNAEISNKIESRLQSLVASYPDHPRILITVESGNSERSKIATTLENLFKPTNLGEFPRNNTFIGSSIDPPISIITNPINRYFTQSLLEILGLYIDSHYRFTEPENFPISHMKIHINGSPIFQADGRVKVE